MYDVIVVGAGPAGATAAALLARRERGVLLVEADSLPHQRTQTAWVGAQAAPLIEAVGAKPAKVLGKPFTEVTFYDAELAKSAKPDAVEATGYLVDRSAFDHALVKAAVAAGAELRDGWPVADVALGENDVEIKPADASASESLRGRMLLAAVGYGSDLGYRLRRAGHSPPPPPRVWIAQVEADRGKPSKARSRAGGAVSVILGLNRDGAFGLAMVTRGHLAVSIVAGSAREVADLFPAMCQRLAAHGVTPLDLSSEAAKAQSMPSPAGIALEMDSHVAKHALVTGEAGGFVSASSNEGIYPAMWSAQIAAEVMHQALDDRHSQDVLMQFDSRWRMSMAEHLQPPNTDIQFLLPLIFTNQPMADRMGAAFFAGKNI